MKTCKYCQRELPFEAFNKKKAVKDGYSNYCRTCVNGKEVSVETKTCQKCDLERTSSEFHKMKSSEDGLHPYCKSCKASYAAKLYDKDKERILIVKAKWRHKLAEQAAMNAKQKRDTNRAFIHEIKSVPCADCDKSFDPICMDFDHLGDKSFSISQAMSCSLDRLLAEIDKCEVVCANCHRLRTRDRRVGVLR